MTEKSYQSITQCRSCGGHDLRPVLDLGAQPLANALFESQDDARSAPRYPLSVVVCRSCWMFQLTYAPPPEVLFAGYAYQSSVSSDFVAHAKRLSDQTLARFQPTKHDLVVEIGSNDGCLLKNYVDLGHTVLGIDPSESAAKAAIETAGVDTLCTFFNLSVAEQLAARGQRAAIIHANNVMAHIPDIQGFIKALDVLLADDGVAVIEAPYLGRLIDRMYFDTIYHEHIFYFSVTALDHAFQRQGMAILDVELVPIHGGSLRITAGRPGRNATLSRPRPAVQAMKDGEAKTLSPEAPAVQGYSERVTNHIDAVADAFERGFTAEKTIAAYGAAAKAAVMLNALKPGSVDQLAYVVDRNPLKQNRFMAGIGTEITDMERLKTHAPDCLAIMPWNIAGEISKGLVGHIRADTDILTCLPDITIKPLSAMVSETP